MTLSDLYIDQICVIFGYFSKFDDCSGLVYSCKRMYGIWKDNKAKFDMMYEIKTKNKVHILSTIEPKKMEITMEDLVWEISTKKTLNTHQVTKNFQFKILLKIEVIVRHNDNITNDDAKLYRKACIVYIKNEMKSIEYLDYESLKEATIWNNGRPISCVCHNLSEQEFKKIIEKDYCFQARIWMEVARI